MAYFKMKSRIISKTRHFCDYIVEKLLEWREFLYYSFIKRKEWTSNLTESYNICKKQRHKQHVEDFLYERERALKLNRYRMEINEIEQESDEDIIGYVVLHRKKRVISTATLKTKKSDSENCKLIYWSFETEKP